MLAMIATGLCDETVSNNISVVAWHCIDLNWLHTITLYNRSRNCHHRK